MDITVRVYELMIVLYSLSVLFYFIDFLRDNQKANQVAFWLLSIVWLLQTVFLIFRVIQTGRFPILTVFEGLYFYVWVLVTLSIIINHFLRTNFLLFFVNVLGFCMMALHTFMPVQHESTIIANRLVSELLVLHITMAMISYGALSFSGVFSLLYMMQYTLLKEKKWGKWLLRLDDLSKLDYLSYVLNMIGLPMLILSLILGVIWAYVSMDIFIWHDAKVLGSFMLIIVYAFYFYRRMHVQGKAIAYWNIGSLLLLLVNFFLIGNFSKFHLWYS